MVKHEEVNRTDWLLCKWSRRHQGLHSLVQGVTKRIVRWTWMTFCRDQVIKRCLSRWIRQSSNQRKNRKTHLSVVWSKKRSPTLMVMREVVPILCIGTSTRSLETKWNVQSVSKFTMIQCSYLAFTSSAKLVWEPKSQIRRLWMFFLDVQSVMWPSTGDRSCQTRSLTAS